jgi:hypothetical protein
VGKVPGDSEHVLDYLNGKQLALSTTVLVKDGENDLLEAFIGPWFHLVHSAVFLTVNLRLRRGVCEDMSYAPLLGGFIQG